jgi:peptidyl-prolyl cis-trans isomerase B (cyclophilin B)
MKLTNSLSSITFYFISSIIFLRCTPSVKNEKINIKQDIEIITNQGTIVLRLYDETPLHRDNFTKLVNDQFFDSVLFHRVIEKFMIQSGDPDSRTAAQGDALGESDLPYKIPAEFHPNLFHKRGALGAARDNNPERASSSTQFYIVQGRMYNDSTLDLQQIRINNYLAMNRVVNKVENQEMSAKLNGMRDSDGNPDSIQMISNQLKVLADLDLENSELYSFPEIHRAQYKSIGGAAHLDQNYTVFGEVIQGLSIVDKIAASTTDEMDRPVDDIRIITARMIDRTK